MRWGPSAADPRFTLLVLGCVNTAPEAVDPSARNAVLFPTVTFAIFFLIVLPLNWLTMHNPRNWRIMMLVASYLFYAWWDPWFVLLLAASTLFNQLIAVRIFKA